jgi:hypothetical protein
MAIYFIIIFFVLVGVLFFGFKLVVLYKTFQQYKVHFNNSRSFINSLPGYVFIFTENLQYYDCNDAVLNVLGMKYDDLINKPLGLVNNNLNFANKLESFNLSNEAYQSFVMEDNVDFSEIKKYFFCVFFNCNITFARKKIWESANRGIVQATNSPILGAKGWG